MQRMVISLSSDKAVWDAVLNNEVVRELKESLDAGWYSQYKFQVVLILSTFLIEIHSIQSAITC